MDRPRGWVCKTATLKQHQSQGKQDSTKRLKPSPKERYRFCIGDCGLIISVHRKLLTSRKMKFSFLAISIASIASVASGNSIFPEKNSCAENRFACSNPGTSATSLNRQEGSSLDTTLSIRGGAVLEPTSLAEVDDVLMKASAEGKLVVVDFSATWVSQHTVSPS